MSDEFHPDTRSSRVKDHILRSMGAWTFYWVCFIWAFQNASRNDWEGVIYAAALPLFAFVNIATTRINERTRIRGYRWRRIDWMVDFAKHSTESFDRQLAEVREHQEAST